MAPACSHPADPAQAMQFWDGVKGWDAIREKVTKAIT